MNTIGHLFDLTLSLLLCPLLKLWLIFEKVFPRELKSSGKSHPIRIAYLLTDSWVGEGGGAGSHQLGFCEGLISLGHTPIPVTSQEFRDLGRVAPDYRAFVQQPRPKYFPRSWMVLANNFFLLRKATGWLKSMKPDVVCQRQSKMNLSGLILSRILHVPFMLEYNSPSSWKAAATDRHNAVVNWVSRFIETLNVNGADQILVVSQVLKDFLVERGLNAQKIIVNPNGAHATVFRPDLDANEIRRKHGLDGKVVVGFAGICRPWHGVEYLAQAIPQIIRKHDHVRFFFIGDQGLVDMVTGIVGSEDCARAVSFVTKVVYSQMPMHYAACDVLVSPHIHMADGGTFFGSPIKMFEYMAMGKAIVASGVGQIAEILKDGISAKITQPKDVDGIAQAISLVCCDPDLRARLGQAARQTCLNQYTWGHNASRFIEGYFKVLDKTPVGVELQPKLR